VACSRFGGGDVAEGADTAYFCALAARTGGFYYSAFGLAREAVDLGETETGSLAWRLGREERFEDPIDYFRQDAFSSIPRGGEEVWPPVRPLQDKNAG